jgi:hypothetical protein
LRSLIVAMAEGREAGLHEFRSKLRQRRCCVFQISVCHLQQIAEHAFERSAISAGLSEGYRNSALAVFQIAMRASRALHHIAFRAVGAALLKRCSFVEDLVRRHS